MALMGVLAPPLLGLATFCAYRSYRTFKKEEKVRARASVEQFLQKAVGTIQGEAVQQFKQIEVDGRAAALKLVDGAVKAAEQELAAQVDSLKQAQQMSSKERSEEGALIKAKLDGVTKFLADIKTMLGMASKATFVPRQ